MAVMQAMSGTAFAEMMERLHAQFDFVILDSGPVLTGPGAMICGQHVDAAVLSTRRDISRLPKIDEACKRLQSVGIFVLGKRCERHKFGRSFEPIERCRPQPPASACRTDV